MKVMLKTARGWPLASLVLFLAVAALLYKPLINGVGWSHSYYLNSVWVLEFNDSLHRGQLPPRWLHGGFNGLGSPSFYYYPPLSFYVTAAIRAIMGARAEHTQLIAWAVYVMTAASGLTMFGWLHGKVGAAWALAGALAYVFAPYHQIDYFVRGALGETAAYAITPFMMLALERAAVSRRWIPGLAFGYAGLILSHLAIAVLVSVSVIAPFTLWLIVRAPKEGRLPLAVRCAAGVLLGVMIAASYLGPAIFMQRFASLQWMWDSPAFEAYNWVLLRPDLWPSRPFSESMAWLGWGTGALGLAAVLAAMGKTWPPREHLREAAVWGGIVLFGLLLYATPWVWRGVTGLLLSKAQFPFRLLLGMEFAAITGVVLAAGGGRWPRLLVLVPLCIAALNHGFDMNAADIKMHRAHNGDLNAEISAIIAARHIPQEHLPAGADTTAPRLADLAYMSGFTDVPMARPLDVAAKVTRTGVMPDGTVVVEMQSPRPTLVILHRFYFPTWRAYRVQDGRDPQQATEAYGRERLLAFQAEAGTHAYRIRIERSTLEKVCDAASVLAILIALALLCPSVMEALKKFRKGAI